MSAGLALDHPPLEGEGRTAEGSPGWGDGRAVRDTCAEFAAWPSPPPGRFAADLPPAEPRYSEGSATQHSDRSRQQPTSVVGGGRRDHREEHKASPLPAGRTCPLDYFYGPAAFARHPDFAADILYVAGGLYGNLAAAHAIERLAAAERGNVAIIYNGDFHWFDAEDAWFDAVERVVTPHRALRGNVETEIARLSDIGAGCGCAYPSAVADDVVMRSNLILSELRGVAARAPAARARVAGLPMHLVAGVGGLSVGIVHGDATSLAGWGFTRQSLAAAPPTMLADLKARSRIDVFASTHTCLALLHDTALPSGRLTVINNGAAGMPNFAGTRYGLISRIATTPSPYRPVYGLERDGVHVDALAVGYDHGQFLDRFLARWPAGTPAHLSYARRILEGPAHTIARALGSAAE
jgi:hypothetical protein